MTLEISSRQQRLLAMGIALVLLLVAIFWVVMPLWESASLHADRVAMLKRQVVAMQSLVDARPRLEAEIKTLSANPEIQNLTYSADQPALAVAQLQGQLNQIFSGVSAAVTSAQVLPDAREGALVKVSLQLTVEANVRSLVAALHAIGAARPLLTVDSISTKDPDGDWAVAPQAKQANTLLVDVVVSAYMRVPSS